jgi:2-haloacid dehalogenase/putative hydrolase of the HAD superfamily
MTQRRFDALLLDFYGTISAGDRAAVEAACTRIVETFDLAMTPNELAVIWGERFFRLIDESNHDGFRTLHECELQSLRETMLPLAGEIDPHPFVVDLETYWADPPIHDDVLDALARIDLPICCVSNADTAPLLAAMEKHGLQFDHVITSEAVRAYKPDAHIFREALTRLGATSDRAIHVGDSLHSDIGGASRLGIHTAWLCRDDRIHDIGTTRADTVLASLADLPALLAGR